MKGTHFAVEKMFKLVQKLLQQRQAVLEHSFERRMAGSLEQCHQRPEGVLLAHVQQQEARYEPHPLHIPHLLPRITCLSPRGLPTDLSSYYTSQISTPDVTTMTRPLPRPLQPHPPPCHHFSIYCVQPPLPHVLFEEMKDPRIGGASACYVRPVLKDGHGSFCG